MLAMLTSKREDTSVKESPSPKESMNSVVDRAPFHRWTKILERGRVRVKASEVRVRVKVMFEFTFKRLRLLTDSPCRRCGQRCRRRSSRVDRLGE